MTARRCLPRQHHNDTPDGRERVRAQRRIVEALDLDRAALYEFVDADGSLLFTHFWSRPGFPEPPRRQVTTAAFPWLQERLLRGETVIVPKLDDVPSALDRENARRFGVKSNLSIPLVVGGQTVGSLGFSMMRHEREWSPELVARLQLVARVFASALDRKRTDEKLRQALVEVEQLRDRLRDENAYLREEVSTLSGSSLVVGRSPAIRAALEQVQQVAPTPATVLLTGETGTGKELFATQIHALSPRRERVMVRVNCAAIPSALIENELFGREKGAYTGAIARQAGRFEVADKSTLFLDEIGDLPLEVQVKLLRVLQEREIERLGSSKPIKVDVRIVAATNQDLEQAVAAQGAFREDLYYRLNVFPLRVPPLRDRTEDLAPLVWSFVDEFSKAFGKDATSIPKDSIPRPGAAELLKMKPSTRRGRNIVERSDWQGHVTVPKGGRSRQLPLTHPPSRCALRRDKGAARLEPNLLAPRATVPERTSPGGKLGRVLRQDPATPSAGHCLLHEVRRAGSEAHRRGAGIEGVPASDCVRGLGTKSPDQE